MEQLTDLLVTIGKRTHGINVYDAIEGQQSVVVPEREKARLRRWARANRVRLHMLVADRRQVLPRVVYRYRAGITTVRDIDRLPETSQSELRAKLR